MTAVFAEHLSAWLRSDQGAGLTGDDLIGPPVTAVAIRVPHLAPRRPEQPADGYRSARTIQKARPGLHVAIIPRPYGSTQPLELPHPGDVLYRRHQPAAPQHFLWLEAGNQYVTLFAPDVAPKMVFNTPASAHATAGNNHCARINPV